MNNKGFTLIELIVTIALLAVIAVISFVSINGVIEQSKVNDCENLLLNIESAAKEYVSDNRYNKEFINNKVVVEDGKKVVKIDNVKDTLINDNKLSGNIISPFDGDDVTNYIKIVIELNDNYTANEVTISYDTDFNGAGNSYSELKCDVEW